MIARVLRSSLTWLNANLEKTVLLAAYTTCAGIIATEVFRRYVFAEQAPWSTTIPAYMFLWLTWVGAAYGVKIRAHLCFTEVRDNLPKKVQFILLQLDNLLFLAFAYIVITYSMQFLDLQMMNFATVPGTDNVPAWWFYSATPVGWALLVFRVLQNMWIDFSKLRRGEDIVVRGQMALD